MSTVNNKPSRARVLVTWTIVGCLVFFLVGGLLAFFGALKPDRYVLLSGIVGGVASVLGLISLTRPTLNQNDIDSLEVQSLKRIAEAADEIRKLETARITAQEEIGSLENQKRQMELLVQKASLSLFLKEQRTLLFERIKEEIRGNDELLLDLEKLGSIDRKLQALEVEIESDPNVDLLRRVIAEASGFAPSEKFANFPPFTRLLLQTVDQVGRIMFAIR